MEERSSSDGVRKRVDTSLECQAFPLIFPDSREARARPATTRAETGTKSLVMRWYVLLLRAVGETREG